MKRAFPQKIYDVSDIASDPHYRARDMLLDGEMSDGTAVVLPGIVPKLSARPAVFDVERRRSVKIPTTFLSRLGLMRPPGATGGLEVSCDGGASQIIARAVGQQVA